MTVANRLTPVYARTDDAGRFCISWPDEQALAGVAIFGGSPRGPSDARVRRVVTSATGPVLFTNRTHLLAEALNAKTFTGSWTRQDEARFCPRPQASPAWYRQESLFTNAHVLVLLGLPALAVVLAGASFGFRRRWSTRHRLRVLAVASASAAASVVLYLAFWSFPTA
jgi:hypothetical protein